MGATMPPSDEEFVAELRAKAAHARRLARYVIDNEAGGRLQAFADELEAQADALEAEDKS